MKKLLLGFYILFITIMFVGCSKDDNNITLSQDQLVGMWVVTSLTQGDETIKVPDGYIYVDIQNNNRYFVKFIENTYSGKFELKGNTMIGITLDPITEYFKFEELNNDNAKISYSNSEGQRYKFVAKRK